ncbi:MAG: NAD(P)/FAD-dependent oxidoreductase [bacterium]
MRSDTLVIGGGIQGSTLALALADKGVRSAIVEAGPAPLSRASLRNEGKIHLGFVYALDHSGETVDQMVTGALSFAPLLERWCGPIDWAAMRSEPFSYLVMPDSLAPADELAEHNALVGERIEALSADLGADYCGCDPRVAARRGVGLLPGLDPSVSTDWFATPEVSLDPRSLGAALTTALASNPLIDLITDHQVVGVTRTEAGFTLACDTPSGSRRLFAEQVVDCAWQGRAVLDAQAGLEPERLTYRLKHQVIVSPKGRGAGAAADLTPATLVQGAFGDLVPWPGVSEEIYLSWYPAGRTFIGTEPEASEVPDPAVAEETLTEMQRLFPALRDYRVVDHAPAWILAPDVSQRSLDISEGESPLHDRSQMDLVSEAGWWSPRSYKLTTAPLASERCAEQVALGAPKASAA